MIFKYFTLVLVIPLFGITIHSQIISQFTWNSNPVTNADIGPNATSIGSSAISDVLGTLGANGLNAGLPKQDINMIIPGSPTFDVDGIDIAIDYQRDESDADLFSRVPSLKIGAGANFNVQYRVEDGSGSYITINSGNVFSIPNDDIFRRYRFYYLPDSGEGILSIDGVVVWSNDGPDNRKMYWTGSGDVTVGARVDGSGGNKTTLDSLVVASVTSSPLPIELTYFTATTSQNKYVLLDWQTASEINNDYFTIERSKDGLEWKEVTQINGAGNSSQTLTYSTIDSNPFEEISFYRLKQTDYDGQFEYSNIRSVNLKIDFELIKIYPNPAIDKITIAGLDDNDKDFRVFNLLGQDVTSCTRITTSNESQLFIDVSTLRTGIYYIKIGHSAGKFYKE
ncbi:MAG: hypothetical protein ACI8Q1_002097 [Parvicella sp.]|jgi:hypothetical protein